MQRTIALFRGPGQGPHHSPGNLSTRGADHSPTETQAAVPPRLWATGHGAQQLAQDRSASRATAGCAGHAASPQPRFSHHLSLIRLIPSKAVSTIRQDAISCPGAAQGAVRHCVTSSPVCSLTPGLYIGPRSRAPGGGQRRTDTEPRPSRRPPGMGTGSPPAARGPQPGRTGGPARPPHGLSARNAQAAATSTRSHRGRSPQPPATGGHGCHMRRSDRGRSAPGPAPRYGQRDLPG